MTTLREAAQQALEALESLFNWQVDHERGKRCGDAVAALHTALAQFEKEPYAEQSRRVWQETQGRMRICPVTGGVGIGTPPPQQQAEPVALIRDGVLRWHIPHEHYSRPAWTAHGTHMLYAQPQPPRKPLTDEDIEQAQRTVWRSLPSDFDYTTSSWIEIGIRYAEAAHGIGEKP